MNISQNAGQSDWPSVAVDSAARPHVVWEDNSPGNFEVLYLSPPEPPFPGGTPTPLTSIFVGVFVGRLAMRLFKLGDGRWRQVLELLIGLVILALLTSVPIMGFFITLAVLIFGLGAMWLGLVWQPLVERRAEKAALGFLPSKRISFTDCAPEICP